MEVSVNTMPVMRSPEKECWNDTQSKE